MYLPEKSVISVSTDSKQREVGYLGKQIFELSNHLGNILATITDKKLQVSTNTTSTAYFEADLQTVQDYYAFGMQMPGRKLSGGYRYGFNGKENDNEVKGEGNQQDYGMRIYDGRIGKFLSVDPLTPKYPELTPYQFASNRPIDGIDRDGLEYCPYITKFNTEGRSFSSYVSAFDNGFIDILNLVPSLWNSGVATVQSINRGTYGQDLRQDAKQTWSGLKETGTKVWNEPLKTLTSPEALEFVVASYAGGKMIPTVAGGGKGNLMKPSTSVKPVTTILTEATEAATQEKVLLKQYGGAGGGHHVPAKSAFVGAVGYDINKALAIPNAELARLGINHGIVTGAQMVAYKGFAATGKALTWEAISTIETNALIKGGLKATSAKAVVSEAINDLKQAGVTNPTRIPWGGK
jgi:RHS repeat-associated protein